MPDHGKRPWQVTASTEGKGSARWGLTVKRARRSVAVISVVWRPSGFPEGVRLAVGRSGARAATREEKGELGHLERGDEVAGGALASSAVAAGFSK